MQTKRIIVFLFGCILARTILVLMAKNLNKEYLKIMGYLALPIGLSFIYLYFFGNQRADSQLEWLGDKKIWWNQMRLVHGLIWLLFAVLAFTKFNYSWIILAIDTLIGLSVWILHTFYDFDFN